MGDTMATNNVTAQYTEVIDLQTTTDKTSVIGIHTPIGKRPLAKLSGLFTNYRFFKYNGCSVQMVPAAQLPVDPLGLTGIPGTTDLMDPRDLLNPIISHGCHGESMSKVLNRIYRPNYVRNGESTGTFDRYSDSVIQADDITEADGLSQYYNCLTDVTWKKHGIQQGLRLKWLRPLVHRLAQNAPLVPMYTGVANDDRQQWQNMGYMNGVRVADIPDNQGTVIQDETPAEHSNVRHPLLWGYSPATDIVIGSSPSPMETNTQIMTNGLQRLGWLPTFQTRVYREGSEDKVLQYPTLLPKLFMSVIVLPPAYNVQQYFRMVVRHSFSFRGFTTSVGAQSMDGVGHTFSPINTYFNWIKYTTQSTYEEGTQAMQENTTLDIIGGESKLVTDGVQ